MRIGVIVDGMGEVNSLPKLFENHLNARPNTILNPIYADMQPWADPPQIARVVAEKAPVLLSRRVNLIVILIDHEQRRECTPRWAVMLSTAIRSACAHLDTCLYEVVVKDSCYENWLISDPAAFRAINRRFDPGRIPAMSGNNGADRPGAENILNHAAIPPPYHKVKDPPRILLHADPLRMAANSRSFRRFLRVVGHPRYAHQSKVP